MIWRVGACIRAESRNRYWNIVEVQTCCKKVATIRVYNNNEYLKGKNFHPKNQYFIWIEKISSKPKLFTEILRNRLERRGIEKRAQKGCDTIHLHTD